MLVFGGVNSIRLESFRPQFSQSPAISREFNDHQLYPLFTAPSFLASRIELLETLPFSLPREISASMTSSSLTSFQYSIRLSTHP